MLSSLREIDDPVVGLLLRLLLAIATLRARALVWKLYYRAGL
jgi:hypothetical protein